MTTGPSSSVRRGECHERGVTLVEVMISLLLVVTGLLGVYAAYTAAVRGTSHGNRASLATAKAEHQLEILRHAPTAAIQCLAACGQPPAGQCNGTCAPTCAAECCRAVVDGGAGCLPTIDGGLAKDLCLLVPPPESTLRDGGGTVFKYCDPTVTIDPTLPFLYDVRVEVQYTLTGEAIGGTDVRSTALRTALYKP